MNCLICNDKTSIIFNIDLSAKSICESCANSITLQQTKYLTTKIIELNLLFDFQHKRTAAADKAWQKAHNRPDTIPDLGELIKWLMSKADIKYKE